MKRGLNQGVTVGIAPIALAVMGALGAGNAWADGVEYHGYVRTQVGGTSEGGNLQCFDPGWPNRGKFRLGNECDTFGEAFLALSFGETNGPWTKYHLGLAYQPKDASTFESTGASVSQAGDKSVTFNQANLTLANTENYFEGGGFFEQGALEDAKVWVGKRYYNRRDIHITDYYYWNNSGVGAGLTEVKAGPAKLGFAYHQMGGNANAQSDVVGNRYSLHVYDMAVNPGGKLEAELVALKGTTASKAPTGSGSQLFLQHTQSNVLGGSNTVALVLGKDLGNGFEWLPSSQGAGPAEGSSVRIHDALNFEFKGTKLSGQMTASYGKMNDGKASFWNVGVRPQYNFTANTSLAVEISHQQGENGDSKPTMDKITIAPQFTLSGGFWARPVFRAFVTHAKWNADAASNGVANGVFGDRTSGTTYGVSAEAWW